MRGSPQKNGLVLAAKGTGMLSKSNSSQEGEYERNKSKAKRNTWNTFEAAKGADGKRKMMVWCIIKEASFYHGMIFR